MLFSVLVPQNPKSGAFVLNAHAFPFGIQLADPDTISSCKQKFPADNVLREDLASLTSSLLIATISPITTSASEKAPCPEFNKRRLCGIRRDVDVVPDCQAPQK